MFKIKWHSTACLAVQILCIKKTLVYKINIFTNCLWLSKIFYAYE